MTKKLHSPSIYYLARKSIGQVFAGTTTTGEVLSFAHIKGHEVMGWYDNVGTLVPHTLTYLRKRKYRVLNMDTENTLDVPHTHYLSGLYYAMTADEIRITETYRTFTGRMPDMSQVATEKIVWSARRAVPVDKDETHHSNPKGPKP